MSTFHNRSMSLVERKRLQWAKEREELASLCVPWGPPDKNQEPKSVRSRYATKVSMLHNEYLRKDYRDNRRNSLPPLYKNQYNSYDRYDREKELGGETSGYGSDNPNHTPDCKEPNWHQSGYESSSSRDDRPKWGDKGVGVGKFWQPKDEHFEKNQTSEPPNWVKRGLQDGEIVVSNTSPAESPEQRYDETDRPCTGSSYSQQKTYIRGQNIPIDSVELAERERRRQLAMAHQEAVRQQLEERERKRREERQRRIQEEQEEELRIEREQEMERQRKEKELKIMMEKQERERKRKEAIEEAIELAQKAAILEKTNKKMNKQVNNNNNIVNITETDKFSSSSITESPNKSDITEKTYEENNSNNEQLNNTRIMPTKSESLNNEINNNLDIKDNIRKSPISARERATDNKSLPPIPSPRENVSNNINNVINNNVATTSLFTPRTENMALVFQTPLETLQNIQYALLVPATPQAIPGTIPANVHQVDRSCNTSRTENRLLTPTQYRNKNRRVCDTSTQTEDSDFGRTSAPPDIREKFIREKLTNLELNYENRNRKERRSRSESLEERPKWGANRPPTRYLKQSEKDPLYQRRKLRQKMRDCKSYDDKISSDESQTATTPRSYRSKRYVEKRHARAQWRKNDHVFTRNIRMYQTEIIPLESDKDQIYYKTHECCCMCKCERRKNSRENIKVDILRIERTSPRETAPYKAEFIETSDRIQDGNLDDANSDVFEKLSSLQNSLLLKQEQWETCPSSPSLSSAHRN